MLCSTRGHAHQLSSSPQLCSPSGHAHPLSSSPQLCSPRGHAHPLSSSPQLCSPRGHAHLLSSSPQLCSPRGHAHPLSSSPQLWGRWSSLCCVIVTSSAALRCLCTCPGMPVHENLRGGCPWRALGRAIGMSSALQGEAQPLSTVAVPGYASSRGARPRSSAAPCRGGGTCRMASLLGLRWPLRVALFSFS